MDPIRTEHETQLDAAPWSSSERVGQHKQTEHALDQNGAVVSHTAQRQIAAACGCLAPIGGYCWCGAAVCQKCFHHCQACSAPLCPRHSQQLVIRGVQVRCCEECTGSWKRRTLFGRAVRALLSPFVEFKDEQA